MVLGIVLHKLGPIDILLVHRLDKTETPNSIKEFM
jgi:hypothetical protein